MKIGFIRKRRWKKVETKRWTSIRSLTNDISKVDVVNLITWYKMCQGVFFLAIRKKTTLANVIFYPISWWEVSDKECSDKLCVNLIGKLIKIYDESQFLKKMFSSPEFWEDVSDITFHFSSWKQMVNKCDVIDQVRICHQVLTEFFFNFYFSNHFP